MKTLENYNFQNKKALIRVDFNVPLDAEKNITDDTRIRAALPTIQHVINNGGSAIIMSHLGRPKNGPENDFSLIHLVSHLEKLSKVKVHFSEDCIGEKAKLKCNLMKPGEITLLENVRFHKEETKGDLSFAKKLASLGDCYINDAFGTAHRAHASTTVIARNFSEDKMFGFLMEGEIKSLEKVLNSDKKPLTAIIGGAKVSSKLPIIENLINKVDNLIIGGGMAYTFIKANGGNIGKSLVENDFLNTATSIQELAKNKKVNLYLPIDTATADAFDNNATKSVVNIENIPAGLMGLDIGEKSEKLFSDVIENSKLILWNGPMGVFEFSNFENGTKSAANAIVKATQKGAFSLIGGGDSVAAINKFNLSKEVSYVSTGGGAMLEYLEGKTLPGIHAILN
ncbi:MAG: phosphoglycerate kinase [Crocinitomicaceae bacterium]|nr:phosphoglycerate kinase [Crocinitomicaceae bacterium]